ncbi:MAG TPA: hypothetical protein VFS05_00805 [Gemmatimonadaceae bacterium]|nr:hypothetical protein [Gemmatimonadaceae bacterium]
MLSLALAAVTGASPVMLAAAPTPPALHAPAPFAALLFTALTSFVVSVIASVPYALGRVRGVIFGCSVGAVAGGLFFYTLRFEDRPVPDVRTAATIQAVGSK